MSKYTVKFTVDVRCLKFTIGIVINNAQLLSAYIGKSLITLKRVNRSAIYNGKTLKSNNKTIKRNIVLRTKGVLI